MLMVGYFEGIDSQRGITCRCRDSVADLRPMQARFGAFIHNVDEQSYDTHYKVGYNHDRIRNRSKDLARLTNKATRRKKTKVADVSEATVRRLLRSSTTDSAAMDG
jgi:hypothetical protein